MMAHEWLIEQTNWICHGRFHEAPFDEEFGATFSGSFFFWWHRDYIGEFERYVWDHPRLRVPTGELWYESWVLLGQNFGDTVEVDPRIFVPLPRWSPYSGLPAEFYKNPPATLFEGQPPWVWAPIREWARRPGPRVTTSSSRGTRTSTTSGRRGKASSAPRGECPDASISGSPWQLERSMRTGSWSVGSMFPTVPTPRCAW